LRKVLDSGTNKLLWLSKTNTWQHNQSFQGK